MGQDDDASLVRAFDDDTGPFVREEDLQRETGSEPLGGCDVEHCQRMHE
jgi:hypothetical protein